jgi:hypothetical protein
MDSVNSVTQIQIRDNDNCEEEEQRYKQLSKVKKFLIIFCVNDMIVASILLTVGYLSETTFKYLKIDSILMIILSLFGLLSVCLEICCFEMQTIVTYFLLIIFNLSHSLHIWILDSHSNLVIEFLRIFQFIILIIMLIIFLKLIHKICITSYSH